MRIYLLRTVLLAFIVSSVVAGLSTIYIPDILPSNVSLTYYVQVTNETLKLAKVEKVLPTYRLDLYYPFRPGNALLNIVVLGLKGSYSIYVSIDNKLVEYRYHPMLIHVFHPYLAIHIYLVLTNAYPISSNVKVIVYITVK
ncbi:MAG: hypothetical protein GXO43_05285 [Crenarchaeota archaeon]|nr:hypothetical protein [Thermoproteota archaeon]